MPKLRYCQSGNGNIFADYRDKREGRILKEIRDKSLQLGKQGREGYLKHLAEENPQQKTIYDF